MTTLVVSELITTLEQEVTSYLDIPVYIYGLKLKLVMFNDPDGTFIVNFKSGSTVLSSVSFTSADIKENLNTEDDYGYAYHPIVFNTPFLIKKGTFTIELTSSGYTFASDKFLGWSKDFENNFIDLEDEFNALNAPRSFIIYTLKRA